MVINQIAILSTAIIQNKNHQLLLLKRSKNNKNFKHYWQLPEGKAEQNEPPAKTMSRELSEEIGHKYKLNMLTLEHILPIVTKVQGVTFLLIKCVFQVPPPHGVIISNDHDQYSWFSSSEAIRTLKLVPGTKEILAML